MLLHLAWQATDTLSRRQLRMFQALSDQIQLAPDDQCHALGLDEVTWAAWLEFLQDGPLPLDPPLPDMLRRLAQITFNLLAVAGQIEDQVRAIGLNTPSR